MSQTLLTPTIALDPSTVWTTESLALAQDGMGTQCTGDGKLVLKTMDDRLSIPGGNAIIGFELELWASCPIPILQNDTFTDTAGTKINAHDGETNCDWQTPSGANFQKINSAGRTYYTFENASGYSLAFAYAFTSNYTPSSPDYAVEAVIYSDSSVGDIAEIYARASSPYSFYLLQYKQSDETWRLGKWTGGATRGFGQMSSVFGSWAETISTDSSATARIEVRGTSIKAFINGVERISTTDNEIASGYAGICLQPGIATYGEGTRPTPVIPVEEDPITEYPNDGLQFDSFKVEDLPSDSIRVGLSKDGTTFVGTPKTLLLTASNTYYLIGTPIDLWGGSWVASDIHPDTFSILLERTSSSAAPSVDHARVIIYHTGSGGTFAMGYRETVRQRIQYGWESTLGTAVTASKRLRSVHIAPQPNPEFKMFKPAGEKLDSEQIMNKEWSTSSISGQPCYNELGALLSMLSGLPTSFGTVGQRQEHYFRFDNRGEQKGRSITCVYGEDPSTIDVFGTPGVAFNRGSRVKGFNLAELGIELSRAEAGLSGNMFGHRIELDYAMDAGADDVQTLTITATGGTFDVRFNGSDWTTLTVAAIDAATIDAALEGLTTIPTNGVVVTGTSPFVVTFSGTGMSGVAQPLIEIDATAATGGSVTIAHTTPGGVTEYPLVPIVPDHINVYLADTYASLSSNRMQRCSVMNFNFTDRFSPFWAFNRSNGGNWLDKAEGTSLAARFAVKAHADSEATSLLGTARSNARKFMRIEAIGPIAFGSDPYEFVLDTAVKVASVGQLEDEDGMYMANYELALTEDRNWGNSMIVYLRNLMANTDYQ